jgi:hypothetical protein
MGIRATQAVFDVIAERERQINEEGFSVEHDEQHEAGELSAAGAAYALSASDQLFPLSVGDGADDIPHLLWPWPSDWWKPTTPRRDLVKAAALIIAEIERLDRKAQHGGMS